MPGLYEYADRYSGAGRYNKAEIKQLHEALESHYYHNEGLSRYAAYEKAKDLLLPETAKSLNGLFGPGVDSPKRESSRRYAEEQNLHTPVREPKFEGGFSGSKSRDHPRSGGGESSRILIPKQIKTGMKAVLQEWLDKGASEHYARQQAEKFYVREVGKAYRADTAGASRRSRPSAFDDFGDMGDALDNDEGYGGRPSGPSRSQFTRSSPAGTEDPRFDKYFTDESRYSRGQSYYEDDDVPRFQTRRGFSSSSDGYDDDSDDGPHYGPRSYRTEERRPGGFSSPFSDHDGAYDNDELPRSSRGGPRGYRTEERHPGGFSSSSYFSYGPEDHASGHSERPPLGHSHGRRSTKAVGMKPAEDLYVTLGVSRSVSTEGLKQAHRKLSIKHHPDREKGGLAAKKAATERMAQINQAYDVLKDKKMRGFYDRTGLIASKGSPP